MSLMWTIVQEKWMIVQACLHSINVLRDRYFNFNQTKY